MNLLLLTKCYPYGNTEQFLENEICILANKFDKVIVIACEAMGEKSMKRPLPSNVTACRVDVGSKIKDAVGGIGNIFSSGAEIKEEKKNARGLFKKLFLYYFENKCQRIYRTIVNNNYIDSLENTSFVLYSYWFFATARIGTLIKDKYKPVYTFCRAHGYDLYEERNKMNYLPYRRLFLRSFDNVFPCSRNGTSYLQFRYPDYSEKVKTSLLGTTDYGMGHGSCDGVFRIVSCSRLVPLKRVDMIINALGKLDRNNLKIEWTHIGGGSKYKSLLRLASKKLHNIVYNFMGSIENKDVIKMYIDKPFDLFVNVSSSEGLPVSIMEAISFGIPVVATDVGGTSEIVVDGITGKLIKSDFCPDELAELIRGFVCDRKQLPSRDSCRGFWKGHFMATANYDKLYSFIVAQCLNKPAKHS